MRPKIYVAILAAAAFLGFAANTRLNSIAACTGEGYGPDTYLAYCEASGYGNFEHGALYLSLVPEAVENLRRADVLMLGSSRVQRAFSTEATEAFFRRLGASFYVAGFGYGENVAFAQALIEHLSLRPRAVIVNADPFFDTDLSWPARTLLKTENGDDIYEEKEAWQEVHRKVCGGDAAIGWLCGDRPAIFRSVKDGRWTLADYGPAEPLPIRPAGEDRWLDERDRLVRRAEAFLARLEASGVPRSCVLFTVIPSDFAPYGTARYVAGRTGVDLMTVDLPGLRTTDRSHLTPESAERWSAAQLDRMAPRLARCTQDTPASAGRGRAPEPGPA